MSYQRPAFLRDEETTASETDTLLERSQNNIRRVWDGFIDFAFQGNILQIAIGLM
jgi:large conductance mechanosensitive channel